MVANGSAFGRPGVKIRIVVPDQRNAPGTAGVMWKNGAATGSGIRPMTTIGSENTTRTSLAWACAVSSPVGPADTIVSGASAAIAARSSKTSAARATTPRAARFCMNVPCPKRVEGQTEFRMIGANRLRR